MEDRLVSGSYDATIDSDELHYVHGLLLNMSVKLTISIT